MSANELPDFFLFNRLLNHANCRSSDAIRDLGKHIQASYPQLLTDVLHLRQRILPLLDEKAIANVNQKHIMPIAISIQGGYSFVLALLAVLALGGTAVLISHRAAFMEVHHVFKEARPHLILVEDDIDSWTSNLRPILKDLDLSCRVLSPQKSIMRPRLSPSSISISMSHSIDPTQPGIIIFTSGTTGPPKAALKAYRFFSEDSQSMADLYGIRCDDKVYHCLPVHHVTGTGTSIIPFLLSGACIVFQPAGFDAAEIWNRWRDGELTMFSGVPTMYVRLMEHYRNVLSKRPSREVEAYVEGVRRIRALMSGSSALPRPQQQKWKDLLGGGRQVLERYGSTEANLIFAVSPEDRDIPDGSVGKKMAGAEVRLSDGDRGEIWVRSRSLFQKYLNNPQTTADLFDKEGFFRTGDVARREGDYYFIEGRVSIDILKSGGYKISALDIEREVLGLDYVAEVAVVGVPDEEFGQRVAACVRLNKDHAHMKLSLKNLRSDLQAYLAGYKMPTMLRVVKDIPKTESGKMAKKRIIEELFSQGHQDIQNWRSPKSKL